MLIVHDELDLKPGVARLKWAGGLGGHNGLKDISAHMNTNDYWRLRLGIGHPRDSEEGMWLITFLKNRALKNKLILIERCLAS